MDVLLVEFQIKPAHVDAFAVAIAENAQASRETEPGCRQFDVCRDPARPGWFLLYELYDDDRAVQAHLNTAHYQHMNRLTADWIEHKTVQRLVRSAP